MMATEIVTQIIGWMAAILTILFGLPQLYKVWKHKINTINLLGFYILYFSIVLWSIFGSTFVEKAINVVVSNILSFWILQLTIIFILKNRKEKKNFFIFTFLSTMLSSSVTVFDIVALIKDLQAKEWMSLLFSILAVSGTSFAFLPQTIKSIYKWNVIGISSGMLFLGFFINFLWEIFWFLIGNFSASIIYILIVQIIAMVLYLIQIVIIFTNSKKRKKIKN
ncbi:hypothetical protein [[Mycoplasma] collis]|uniref:hypothetical protein n=1 Tax=[Mycoplasma] collis TaxID=2127 RepID=UPI00051AB4E0|nr:hypothetical protein [[Mycoplasma] collis]